MTRIQTREQVAKSPKGHVTAGLVTQPLSEEQWAQLEQINADLTKEYSVRRQMLLTRCDVTVQSFRWSERVKVRVCNSLVSACVCTSNYTSIRVWG